MRGTAKRNRQEIEDTLDQLRAKVARAAAARPARRRRGQTYAQGAAGHAAPRRRGAAHAVVPGRRARQARARAAHRRSRPRAPIRSTIAVRALRAQRQSVSRRATRATCRRSTRRSRRSKAVTPEAAKAFHSQFYGASNAELAIVGDFDPDGDARARHRALRRLEEPRAVRARARAAACPTSRRRSSSTSPTRRIRSWWAARHCR